MRRDSWNNTQNAWLDSGFPLTIAVIALNLVTLLLFTFRVPSVEFLVFRGAEDFIQPWRLFTYPLVTTDAIGFLFGGLMMYFLGGSLERSWGTRTFGLFFFGIAAISALSLGIGSVVCHSPAHAGDHLVYAAMLVAWATLNPLETITVWFFPIQARIVAAVSVFLLFFSYAGIHPILGIFGLTGCAVSFFWVRNRRWSSGFYSPIPARERRPVLRLVPSKPKNQRPMDDRFTWRDLNPFERLARKRRQKQLEKLLGDD